MAEVPVLLRSKPQPLAGGPPMPAIGRRPRRRRSTCSRSRRGRSATSTASTASSCRRRRCTPATGSGWPTTSSRPTSASSSSRNRRRRSRSPGRAASRRSWASTSSAARSSCVERVSPPGPDDPPHDPDERHAAHRRVVRVARRARVPRRHQHRRPARAARRVPRRQAGAARPSTRCMRGFELLRTPRRRHATSCARSTRPTRTIRSRSTGTSATSSAPRYIQFIPIVERDNDTGFQEGDTVTDRSVEPDAWGDVPHRRSSTSGCGATSAPCSCRCSTPRSRRGASLPAAMCIFAETCGDAVALEHNGDLYSCDHFVEPELPARQHHARRTWSSCWRSPQQRAFGDAKRDTLPRYCRECDVRFACNGECPKNRFTLTPDGEPGLNYLCAGYKAFFTHIDGLMRIMADLLRARRLRRRGHDPARRSAAQRTVPLRQRPQGQALPRSIATEREGKLEGDHCRGAAAGGESASSWSAVVEGPRRRSRPSVAR